MNKSHLQYHWWKYVAVLIVSVILWCSVFNTLAKPAQNECLNILFVGEDINTEHMKETVEAKLVHLTDQDVKQIKVSQLSISGQDLLQVLQSRFYEYDLVIISQSHMQDNMGVTLYYESMKSTLSERFADFDFYAEIGQDYAAIYGVQLMADRGAFWDFYNGSETCYCFPSPNSVNFGGLNGKGNQNDDCALVIMEYLIKGESAS